VLFRSPRVIGADGIDALEGLLIEALSRSPRLALVDTATAGADAVEHYERRDD
jgi:diaminohydroxyphosphoribosylaminopyrimidine deaminase / 5-amino-6-(5-phosphoribosylamino)uracil reductase